MRSSGRAFSVVKLLVILSVVQCQHVNKKSTTSARTPNIILIIADDLGYGDIGAYGQEHIRTPNLDQLAREGTIFNQFYSASPVCAPSRSALMTGLHSGHTPVRGNVGWKRGDMPLRVTDTTFVELLDEAGYATGMYGKWSLGLKGTSGAPHRKGFDEFLGYEDQTEAHSYYVDRLQAIRNGVTVNVDVDTTQYTHDLFVEATLNFIERNQKSPFFLYLPYTIPHAALQVPDLALQPYLNDKGESIFPEKPFEGDRHGYHAQDKPLATYAAMVSRLDKGIGLIKQKLEQLDLAENTILFFTSDNGPHSEGGYDPTFFDSNGPLRGQKRDLYEGGIRVPMIVWGPSTIPANTKSNLIWASWDLFPTLLEFANIEASPFPIDGISMKEALLGGRASNTHDYFYWEFLFRDTFKQAVRRGPWKAIRFSQEDGSNRTELYNLKQDISESSNLAEQHPDKVQELEALMDQSHKKPVHKEFRISWFD